jgi:two-component system, cell cycle response regulator DivK
MPRVLIIEDNEDNRDMLARRLRRRGFDVVIAHNGTEGVEMAGSEAPDVVLMDLNMPDLDGWEATRLLKSSPETQHLPIIALTAHEVSGNRERLLKAGCADYHTKPVQMTNLLAQIEVILKAQQRNA